jgi:uncharacterized damage-inducible protein DinB
MSLIVLQSLFRHKAWANAELFALLGSLPTQRAEELTACLRTLNHVYVVDRIFRAHLCAQPRPYDATNTADTPSLDELGSAVSEIDRWYLGYVADINIDTLSESVAFTFTSGDRGRMSREEILLHVITHGGYHRGNVAQVLKSISVTPPDDPYTLFLHLKEPDRRQA